MYKVIPWDEPGVCYLFDTYIGALQFGDTHYGSRYYLLDLMECDEE